MVDNSTPNANPNPDPDPNPTPAAAPAEQVVLTTQQYADMLDYITSVEAKLLEKTTTPQTDPLDDILAKSQPRPTQQQAAPNLDDMSNTELVKFILSEIHGSAVSIQTEIETLKVLREIDQAQHKYDDFNQYIDRIYELGRDNPTLSIDKAYKLAKAEGKEPPVKSPPTIRGLPPRPAVLQTMGENPSRVPSTTPTRQDTSNIVDLKSAAERAWEDVNKE